MTDLNCAETLQNQIPEEEHITLDDRLADAKRRSDETDDGTGVPPEHDPMTKDIEI